MAIYSNEDITKLAKLSPREFPNLLQNRKNIGSCRGRAVKTSDVHPGGPRFEPQPGSSVLGQGALSSLPSLSEETLSRRSRV